MIVYKLLPFKTIENLFDFMTLDGSLTKELHSSNTYIPVQYDTESELVEDAILPSSILSYYSSFSYSLDNEIKSKKLMR